MKTTKEAGHYNEAPADLSKRPPRLLCFGLPVEERPTIEELEAWLLEPGRLPGGPVYIDPGVEIIDCKKFVAVSLAALKSSGNRELRAPFYYRLLALKFVLDQ